MNKKIALAAFIGTLAIAGILGVSKTYAQDEQPDSLIQKLVEKFNLNKDEVQAVFDEERSERQAENQARFEERLSQAVSEGKITEDQKNLILEKHKELQEERANEIEEWKDLSQEERKEKMEQRREEMKSWMEENGIDLDLMMILGGPGHGRGPGGPEGFGRSENSDN